MRPKDDTGEGIKENADSSRRPHRFRSSVEGNHPFHDTAEVLTNSSVSAGCTLGDKGKEFSESYADDLPLPPPPDLDYTQVLAARLVADIRNGMTPKDAAKKAADSLRQIEGLMSLHTAAHGGSR